MEVVYQNVCNAHPRMIGLLLSSLYYNQNNFFKNGKFKKQQKSSSADTIPRDIAIFKSSSA